MMVILIAILDVFKDLHGLLDPLHAELPDVVKPADERADKGRSGLRCQECRRLFPVVSEIPVMLLDEAIPAEDGTAP